MGLAKRKPFIFAIGVLSFVLLILSCVTRLRSCYYQTSVYGYSSLDNMLGPNNDKCENICAGLPALKQEITSISTSLNMPLYVRCPWENASGDIFLASSCLMCLWFMIETLLTVKRKFYVLLNIFSVFVLALGSIAAGYMYDDLRDGYCEEVEAKTDANNVFKCYRSIFTVSLILQITNLCLWLFQLIYNFIIRNKMNEEEPKYSNIPQQHAVSEPAPQTEQRSNDHRIA